ncbi:hypothetical protein BH18ACI5_BH18ACI5_05630 [soil metagenome]
MSDAAIRLLWQIPIVTAVMGTWLLVLAVMTAVLRGAPVGSAALPAGIVFLVLLVPLGLYWWSAQSSDWVLGIAARRWMSRHAGNRQS